MAANRRKDTPELLRSLAGRLRSRWPVHAAAREVGISRHVAWKWIALGAGGHPRYRRVAVAFAEGIRCPHCGRDLRARRQPRSA